MKFLFYKPIRITCGLSNAFVWSDTHFNHKCEHWDVPIWKARGYSSVEDHNEGLIEKWNSVVDTSSTAFHLGDFIFGSNAFDDIKTILRKMNFNTLYVMPGNHNSGWKPLFEQVKHNVWNVNEQKRVIMIPNYAEVLVGDQLYVMSHYPILSFNGQHRGSICLYGHVHNRLVDTEIGDLYAKAKTIEVTVDSIDRPISLMQIKNMFESRANHTFDSPLIR